ncbi:hypothetical protein L6164_031221 [Bauhinia variegata]|uniref:Uncharacterized protein n=1 Tax=Bauhinia variegata TaxID=167791 RepID=A0ACB9LG25_BAUVA|nr:hypothetical protein L6164_031221 [Bauhinia variegata]
MVGNIILWREVPCNLKYESSWWIEFEFGSELELEQRGDPGAVYILGQVVKCQVTSSIPASWRINLSMIKKPTRVCFDVDDMVKLGGLAGFC